MEFLSRENFAMNVGIRFHSPDPNSLVIFQIVYMPECQMLARAAITVMYPLSVECIYKENLYHC